MNATGKEEQKTLQLARDAKLTDSMGDTEKLEAFHPGDEVFLMEKGNDVTHLSKYALATIDKIDSTGATVTVNIMEKDGSRAEKTFKLGKDTEYFEAMDILAWSVCSSPATKSSSLKATANSRL